MLSSGHGAQELREFAVGLSCRYGSVMPPPNVVTSLLSDRSLFFRKRRATAPSRQPAPFMLTARP